MKHGGPLIHRLKTLISSVQDHYPELIHQAIIAHAPATFSKLFALVSSVLNDRMRSKILVAPATGPITPVAERISARALHSWGSLIDEVVDWGAAVTVANGACEFTARWVAPGETLRWKIALTGGDTVRVFVCWLSEASGSALDYLADVVISTGEVCAGRKVVPLGGDGGDGGGGGCVWLCVDNADAWWNTKEVRAEISLDAPQSAASAEVEVDGVAKLALDSPNGKPAAVVDLD